MKERRLAAGITRALSESDDFRLVIRGHAEIERLIKHAVEEPFEVPPELSARARVQLARSLGILEADLAAA